MLRIPSTGIQRSVTRHNCRIDVLADWIEGSVLFAEPWISKTDVISMLLEEEVYSSEGFAHEFMGDVWNELRFRSNHGNVGALSIDSKRVTRNGSWDEYPAYSFCLALALRHWCSRNESQESYVEQGSLFERLTEESLSASGWRLLRTGWSSTKGNSLTNLVKRISSHIAEPIGGNIKDWISTRGRDAGLDLVCYRPFSDRRGGRPLFFIQCASGARWQDKIKTPDLNAWGKLIDFSNSPIRGFAIPYVLSERRFRRVANSVGGLLLDRLRIILPPDSETNWMTPKLKSDLNNWLLPHLNVLMPN